MYFFYRYFSVFAVVLLSLMGCSSAPKAAYEGLLPPGVVPTSANVELPLRDLKERKAAIVLSANFENYVAQWVERYEQGGLEKRKQAAMLLAGVLATVNPNAAAGVIDAGNQIDQTKGAGRQASDPRRVMDRVYALLKDRFGQVEVAKDFSDAIERRADYIFLIDLYYVPNNWVNIYHYTGGIQVLDPKVRRVFALEASSDPRVHPSDGGASGMKEGLDGIFKQFENGLLDKLRN